MKRYHIGALICALAATLAVGLFGMTPQAPSEAPSRRSPSHPGVRTAPRAADQSPRHVIEGARYAIEIDATVTLGDGAEPITSSVYGAVEVHRLDVAGRPALAVRFEDGAAQMLAGGAPLDTALDRGWWAIELDATGAVQALRSDTEDAMQHGIRSTLASNWLSTAEMPSAERWRRAERDAFGVYPARLRRGPDGSVERRHAPYVTLGPGLSRLGEVEIAVDGVTVAMPGVQPWPESVRGETRVTLGAPVPATSVTRVRFEHHGARPPPTDAAALAARLAQMPRRPLDASLAADARGAERALVDGTTLTGWLDACAAAAGGEGIGRAISGLRAWLTLRPEDTGRVQQAIAGATDPALAEILIGALGSTATPEAERALMALATTAALPEDARGRVVIELGLRAAPAADVLDTLAAVDGPGAVGEAALLATGSVAGRLGEWDPPAAHEAVEGLIERYYATEDPDTQRLLLRALGNAGASEALPLIEATLAEADPAGRALALHALRAVADPRADALLAARLAGDDDPAVRRAAARALAGRSLDDSLGPLRAALADEADPAVRFEVLRAAMGHLPDPRVTAWLTEAAAHEADPALARALAAALGRAVPTL